MDQLVADSYTSMSLYYTKQSRQNVLSHLRQLSLFCVAFNEPFLPVSSYALLGFAELMSRKVSFDHIQHILSSVKFLHDFRGFQYEGDSFQFKVLLRGLRRKLSRPAKQALPITPEMLILMYQFVNIEIPYHLAHWCSFLFALRLLYRKSSIAPESLVSFNARTGLSREKIVISDGVALVYQNHSKTNQFMAANRVIPVVPGCTLALNPVFHYEKLLSENVAPANFPAFSFIENGRVKCVTHKSFTSFLKKLLSEIGIQPDNWTGHSFRRGGASLLYRLGLDPLTIQACGDWSSDTFLRYLEVNIDRLWAAQVAMGSFSCF